MPKLYVLKIFLLYPRWLSTDQRSTNEVHEILKTACNYEERVNEATGEVFKFPKTTTNLSTYDWENVFKKRVKQFALDFFNTSLPEPNSQMKIEY